MFLGLTLTSQSETLSARHESLEAGPGPHSHLDQGGDREAEATPSAE